MLPYYGVFDNLVFKVDGAAVTLLGQVTRPTLKSDAGNAVKGIEGVEKVDRVERQLISYCQSPGFSRQGLEDLYHRLRG